MIQSDFRTKIHPSAIPSPLSYGEDVLLIGSCFSENIGRKLKEGGFPVSINPFGILFNPVSISNALKRMVGLMAYEEKDLVFDKGSYHSLDHHGSFSKSNTSELLDDLNQSIKIGQNSLRKASLIAISLGTANVYSYKDQNKVVANCHKMPSDYFEKQFLSLQDVVQNLSSAITAIHSINSNVTILLTVSPVRYLKDGLVNDRLSKSLLIMASHQLTKEFENCLYFPSYELLNDDLRDYRFYADDMIHPSEMAINYIWEAFKSSVMNKESEKIIQEVEDLLKAINHRPINPHANPTIEFNQQLQKRIEELEKTNPTIELKLHRKLLEEKMSL